MVGSSAFGEPSAVGAEHPAMRRAKRIVEETDADLRSGECGELFM
jgi:hypothetical protein